MCAGLVFIKKKKRNKRKKNRENIVNVFGNKQYVCATLSRPENSSTDLLHWPDGNAYSNVLYPTRWSLVQGFIQFTTRLTEKRTLFITRPTGITIYSLYSTRILYFIRI